MISNVSSQEAPKKSSSSSVEGNEVAMKAQPLVHCQVNSQLRAFERCFLKCVFPFGMFPVFGQDGLPVEPSGQMTLQQPEARTTVGLRSSFFFGVGHGHRSS